MAVLLGNQYLAWIESATPDEYNPIKGQGTFTETRNPQEIDTSDKTTEGFNTGAYGNIAWKGELDVKVKLPDANGYTRLETQCNAGVAFGFQIRKGGLAGILTDAIFAASVYGAITGRTFNMDGTVDVKVGFTLAEAPTVDQLA
jgi:hypothetical protein